MKRKSVYKSLIVSVALSAFLVGCGSNSSNSNNEESQTSTTIQGKAIDGYLQYATVCLDLNSDGYCQNDEPSAQTKEDGSYKLELSAAVQKDPRYENAMLLVYGGKDVDTQRDFIGKLMAPKDSDTINITPITTLIAKKVALELKKDPKMDKEKLKEHIKDAKEKVANTFGLTVSVVDDDPILNKEKNPKLLKEALRIQKSLEALSDKESSDEVDKLYEKLAEKLDEIQGDQAEDIFEVAFKDHAKIQELKKLHHNIDKAIDKGLALPEIAFIAKEDVQKIHEDEDIDEIDNDDLMDYDKDKWNKAFIKSDLEDIGIKNPSDDLISEIQDKLGDDIKPGEIFKAENEHKFKSDQDDDLQEVLEKIKEHQKKSEEKYDSKDKQQNDTSKGKSYNEPSSNQKGKDKREFYMN